jgi:hypothetical protein
MPARASRGAGACGARAARCVPRSTSTLHGVILLVIFGSAVVLVYGRSLPAVIIGGAGILASLEALFHVQRRQWWALPYYAAYLLVQTAASVAVGAAVLVGVGVQCAAAANPGACANHASVFGLILALGSSSVGTLAAITTLFVYYAVRRGSAAAAAAEAAAERKLAL